nr:MAG TPA: hypothetical protein [Caudoviricetes sp.]
MQSHEILHSACLARRSIRLNLPHYNLIRKDYILVSFVSIFLKE